MFLLAFDWIKISLRSMLPFQSGPYTGFNSWQSKQQALWAYCPDTYCGQMTNVLSNLAWILSHLVWFSMREKKTNSSFGGLVSLLHELWVHYFSVWQLLKFKNSTRPVAVCSSRVSNFFFHFYFLSNWHVIWRRNFFDCELFASFLWKLVKISWVGRMKGYWCLP